MTKEKWEQIVLNTTIEYESQIFGLEQLSPENWDVSKTILSDYIKAIDEATEVYNLENKVK